MIYVYPFHSLIFVLYMKEKSKFEMFPIIYAHINIDLHVNDNTYSALIIPTDTQYSVVTNYRDGTNHRSIEKKYFKIWQTV